MLLEEYPKPYGICTIMYNKEKHYYFLHYLSMQIFTLRKEVYVFLFFTFLQNLMEEIFLRMKP